MLYCLDSIANCYLTLSKVFDKKEEKLDIKTKEGRWKMSEQISHSDLLAAILYHIEKPLGSFKELRQATNIVRSKRDYSLLDHLAIAKKNSLKVDPLGTSFDILRQTLVIPSKPQLRIIISEEHDKYIEKILSKLNEKQLTEVKNIAKDLENSTPV